jgi:hypothetical protein
MKPKLQWTEILAGTFSFGSTIGWGECWIRGVWSEAEVNVERMNRWKIVLELVFRRSDDLIVNALGSCGLLVSKRWATEFGASGERAACIRELEGT